MAEVGRSGRVMVFCQQYLKRRAADDTSPRPVIGGTDTVEEAETVLLHRHLAQLVLQTHSMNVHCLVAQKNCLHI